MKKKTTEQFKAEVFQLVGNEYIVMGEYKNSYTKIQMKHSFCGHVWKIKPDDFLHGHGCSKCYGTPKKTTEQFQQEVFQLVGDEYSVLGEYQSNKTKIQMKHNTCGHVWEITPGNFLHGKHCPKCYGNIKKTTEQFKAEVFQLVGDEYEVLGEYQNTKTKIQMKHNSCGHIWEITPDSFLQGHGCPKCAFSKMEKYVSEWLTKQEIPFQAQYQMPGSRLRFDFMLLDRKVAIECQGEQHYVPVCFGGISQKRAKENLITQKERDKQKRQFCKRKGIKLIELPYWYDLEEFLDECGL
jgi:hypothetical protein